jgi:hypothetical protein
MPFVLLKNPGLGKSLPLEFQIMLSDMVSLIGLLIALCTFFGGVVAWYRATVQKSYAAEREFGHIKRNVEQTNQALEHLDECIDRRFDATDRELLEIKLMLRQTLKGMGLMDTM